MEAIWHEMWTARWAADVGLPLLATVVAIVLAALGIRRQLGHDKELWHAQRRAEVARDLGSTLIYVQEIYLNGNFEDGVWQDRHWRYFGPINDKANLARILIGPDPALREIERGIEDLDKIWFACQSRKEALIEKGCQVNAMQTGALIFRVAHRQFRALVSIGETLMQWDGMGRIPKVEWPNRHIPTLTIEGVMSGEGVERLFNWTEYYEDQFESLWKKLQPKSAT